MSADKTVFELLVHELHPDERQLLDIDEIKRENGVKEATALVSGYIDGAEPEEWQSSELRQMYDYGHSLRSEKKVYDLQKGSYKPEQMSGERVEFYKTDEGIIARWRSGSLKTSCRLKREAVKKVRNLADENGRLLPDGDYEENNSGFIKVEE